MLARNSLRSRSPRRSARPPQAARPRLDVELLEARLPPGDVFLGGLLLGTISPGGLPASEARVTPSSERFAADLRLIQEETPDFALAVTPGQQARQPRTVAPALAVTPTTEQPPWEQAARGRSAPTQSMAPAAPASAGPSAQTTHQTFAVGLSVPVASAVTAAPPVADQLFLALNVQSVGTGGNATSQGCSHTSEQYQEIVTFMEERLATDGTPGGSIAIVCNGALNFSAGVGVKHHEGKDPVTPDTLFRVASMSKVLAGISALSLVEEGQLDLHAPITDYLPWFEVAAPYDASSITVHQLLTHTSGIPTTTPPFPQRVTLEEFFRESSPMTLWGPPGGYYNYSNAGFSLAGFVEETIDGRSYADVVQARVFDPAGMTGATFDSEVVETRDFSYAHLLTNGVVTTVNPPTFVRSEVSRPPGGAWISAEDYAHLAETLLDGGRDMLSPESVRELQGRQQWTYLNPDRYYGYGELTQKYKTLDVVTHSGGGANGMTSNFVMVPETKDAVVVLLNSNPGSPAVITNRALDILYDLGGVPGNNYRTDPSTWDVFEGTYYDPVRWGEIRVEVRAERLWFHFMDVDWSGSTVQNAIGSFTINPGGLGALATTFARYGDEPAEAVVFTQNATALRRA